MKRVAARFTRSFLIVFTVLAVLSASLLGTAGSPVSGIIPVTPVKASSEVLNKQKFPTPTSSACCEVYTLQKSGKVRSFDSTAWIDAGADRCCIVGINKDGSLKISLPTNSGRIVRNFKANLFTKANLKDGTFDTYKVTKDFKCYRREGGAQAFGESWKGDIIYHVATSSDSKWIQIIYPITGTSRWRMCWTQKSNMKYMVKIVSRLDFLNEQKNTFFRSAENTISVLQNNMTVCGQIFASKEFLTRVSAAIGGLSTANPWSAIKSAVDVDNAMETFLGLVALQNAKTSCDQAISYARKVLSWKSKTITNANWLEFMETVREMYAYAAVARCVTSVWLDEMAGLNTTAKKVDYLFRLTATGFLNGAFGAIADLNLSKTCTKVIEITSRSTSVLQCLTDSIIYLCPKAAEEMKSARNSVNNIIANMKKMP